jgi:phospholipid/cholesterol/gamma-HCH transport system substrate-binding protein
MSRAFRLGIFVVAALICFGVAVFWIGGQQFMFSSTYRLNAEFQNVAGLGGGADVRVGGMREGTVAHITLPRRPNEKVRVTMTLKNATRDVIKKDSVAAIRSEGLVGDQYVEITFGSEQAAKVKDGDTIGGEPVVQISDLIKKADQMLDSAQGALQNVEDTADNLKSISAKMNQGAGTVGSLLNDKSVYQHVNAGAAEFQEDMEALKHNFLLRGFFRNRGYEDIAELKKYEIPRLPGEQYSKRFVYDGSKIFAKPESAKLKNQKLLDDAGKYLEANPFGLAVVVGYTSMKGDADKDRTLTEARALTVREYLAQHFKLDDTRVKTMGAGKSPEVQDGSRVEILIYPGQEHPAPAKSATGG